MWINYSTLICSILSVWYFNVRGCPRHNCVSTAPNSTVCRADSIWSHVLCDWFGFCLLSGDQVTSYPSAHQRVGSYSRCDVSRTGCEICASACSERTGGLKGVWHEKRESEPFHSSRTLGLPAGSNSASITIRVEALLRACSYLIWKFIVGSCVFINILQRGEKVWTRALEKSVKEWGRCCFPFRL